jgi:hypothetical protein
MAALICTENEVYRVLQKGKKWYKFNFNGDVEDVNK